MGRRPLLSIKRIRIVSAGDCTTETHLRDPGGRDLQQLGKASGNKEITDTA